MLMIIKTLLIYFIVVAIGWLMLAITWQLCKQFVANALNWIIDEINGLITIRVNVSKKIANTKD